jgi:hypothetical protein
MFGIADHRRYNNCLSVRFHCFSRQVIYMVSIVNDAYPRPTVLNNCSSVFVHVSHLVTIWIGIHGTDANFDTPVVFSATILTKITPNELSRIAETVEPTNSTPNKSTTHSTPRQNTRASNSHQFATDVVAQAAAVIGMLAIRLTN